MEVSIKRDAYLKKLIDKRENGAIKVITGLRRSGKSYLLFDIFYNYLLSEKIAEKRIVRLALDNEKNAALRDPDKLSEFLYSKITDEKHTFFVLLDEIQFAISKEELKNNPEKFNDQDGKFSEEKYMDYKIEKMQDVKDTTTHTIDLSLTKKAGIWTVDELSSDDISKLHGLY